MKGASVPKLVMGYIHVVAPDGEDGIPFDDAVIHFEGDEDFEIRIACPGALRLAPLIVRAVNSHDGLVKALEALIDCSNAIVGADAQDDRAADAFEMFNAARAAGRRALAATKGAA